MARSWRSWRVAGMLLAGAAVWAPAQSTPEYQAKVILMDKLTRFVDWPPSAAPRDAFVLAVLGRTPFGDDLDAYFSSRALKDHAVVITYPSRVADLGECDLLFVCASEKPRLGAILERLKGRPVLTVADTEGFAQAGVMVGLVRVGSKVTFEVNLAAAREAGFRMAPGFLQLAKIVP